MRGAYDLSATSPRCCGSRRRTLRQAASLARGYRPAARAKPADRAAASVVLRTRHPPITPKRQMDNIMYLYEQPGPPDDAPKATAAAEDGGLGGLNWVALVLPSTTPRGRRARPRRGEAGRRTPRFSARDCGGRSSRRRSASATCADQVAAGFPIRSQNKRARQSASDARAFKDCAAAISLAPTKS